jgi:hypothetical protein
MSELRISMEERDSFWAQTDRMAAADAHTELLKRVHIACSAVSQAPRLEIESKTTKDGFEYCDVIGVEHPERDWKTAAFVAWRVLIEIEEMLNPKAKSFWRLPQIKQRHRGRRRVPLAIADDIYRDYGGARCFEPQTPIKTVIGRLAAQHDVSDGAIREIVRRMHGKKPKNKKVRKQNPGK